MRELASANASHQDGDTSGVVQLLDQLNATLQEEDEVLRQFWTVTWFGSHERGQEGAISEVLQIHLHSCSTISLLDTCSCWLHHHVKYDGPPLHAAQLWELSGPGSNLSATDPDGTAVGLGALLARGTGQALMRGHGCYSVCLT